MKPTEAGERLGRIHASGREIFLRAAAHGRPPYTRHHPWVSAWLHGLHADGASALAQEIRGDCIFPLLGALLAHAQFERRRPRTPSPATSSGASPQGGFRSPVERCARIVACMRGSGRPRLGVADLMKRLLARQ